MGGPKRTTGLQLKFLRLVPEAKLPCFAHPKDAGMDVFTVEDYTLKPGERHGFKTGIASEIPPGFFIRFAPKSGLSFKDGIDLLAGVIDAEYRGEWIVILVNHGDEPKEFKVGDKVVQAILQKVEKVELIEITELSETQRGDGRFGSTGK